MAQDVAAITRQNFVIVVTAIEDQGKAGAAADLRKFSRRVTLEADSVAASRSLVYRVCSVGD